ncbi:MAG: hypothetical protein BWZ03_00122 [bacterium ADurb.BinA186]|nr:MAG: hypothetical protein BWZ03_00122 [bacterium ADurb.BinA186]
MACLIIEARITLLPDPVGVTIKGADLPSLNHPHTDSIASFWYSLSSIFFYPHCTLKLYFYLIDNLMAYNFRPGPL